jgi:hypothetical protein
MQNANTDEALLNQWIGGALLLPDEQFSPAEPFLKLLSRQLEESKGALSMVLQPQADPHRGVPGVRWSIFAGGMDLIRAHYTAVGVPFTLTESINFAFLRADPASPRVTRDIIQRLLSTAVKTVTADHHWEFDLPEEPDGARNFVPIPNRGAPSLGDLQSRHDRADTMLADGSICFLFYKKVGQLEGFQAADRWFSQALRDALRKEPRNR